MEQRIQATSLSPGIGHGSIVFLPSTERKIPTFSTVVHDVDQEITRYRSAIFSSRQDLSLLKQQASTSHEVAQILDTHLCMLSDPLITEHMEDQIRTRLQSSEAVLQTVMGDYRQRFSRHTDPFFQQRLSDVVDVADRVLNHLSAEPKPDVSPLPVGGVIFAVEVTPSQLAAMPASSVRGIVTSRGGKNSHAAVIARSKGIPYISGVDIALCERLGCSYAIVDADSDQLILDPTEETLSCYRENKQHRPLVPWTALKTADALPIRCYLSLTDNITGCFADGIGLFRTECVLLHTPEFLLSEEDQWTFYLALLKRAQGLPVTIRLFDLGGDKIIEGINDQAINGLRGIQWLLHHREHLQRQLRALLRASLQFPVRVLLPFVFDVSEVQEIKREIKQIAADLKPLGDCQWSLGSMIELPSVALFPEPILQEVDFVAIGTNDLTQYTTGRERTSAASSMMSMHPSVLYLIGHVLQAAAKKGKEAIVCGEMASEPQCIELLLNLGARCFSCHPGSLSAVCEVIRLAVVSKGL